MIWFTSDTHFHHKNIIPYCFRPFVDQQGNPQIWCMNKVMTDNWNSVVKPFDTVYHLGDFAMGPKNLVAPIVKKLNGKKVLIRGNHDRSNKFMLEAGFDEVHTTLTIELEELKIFMAHHPRPEKDWEGCDYHFCGHVHNAFRRRGNLINVGVDVQGFIPKTLQQLLSGT